MRLLEGREEQQCMPSRYHFGLFRFVAYLRLRRVRVIGEPDRILSIHRYQSTVEMFGVSFWVLLTLSCYVAAWLSASLSLPLFWAVLLAMPLAWLAVQFLVIGFGLLAPVLRALGRRPGENNIALNSFLIMLVLVGLSSYLAMQRTWVRFVAWQFLAAIGLNALAAGLVFLFSGEIARLESSVGGPSSESSSLRSR
jgi:hypothetical protein